MGTPGQLFVLLPDPELVLELELELPELPNL
jgi:hypothetical protein